LELNPGQRVAAPEISVNEKELFQEKYRWRYFLFRRSGPEIRGSQVVMKTFQEPFRITVIRPDIHIIDEITELVRFSSAKKEGLSLMAP
jgi:hypothetical protein